MPKLNCGVGFADAPNGGIEPNVGGLFVLVDEIDNGANGLTAVLPRDPNGGFVDDDGDDVKPKLLVPNADVDDVVTVSADGNVLAAENPENGVRVVAVVDGEPKEVPNILGLGEILVVAVVAPVDKVVVVSGVAIDVKGANVDAIVVVVVVVDNAELLNDPNGMDTVELDVVAGVVR